jgi:hypothetical protein
MDKARNTAPVSQENVSETSIFPNFRGRFMNILRHIGIGAAVFVGSTMAEDAANTMAAEKAKRDEVPKVLTDTHEKLDKELGRDVSADDIARQIAASHSGRVKVVGDPAKYFGEEAVRRGRVKIGDSYYVLKVGSSADGERHFVVADRAASQSVNPRLIGAYIEGDEDVSAEEGIELALNDAADNLREAQGWNSSVDIALAQRGALIKSFNEIPFSPGKEEKPDVSLR